MVRNTLSRNWITRCSAFLLTVLLIICMRTTTGAAELPHDATDELALDIAASDIPVVAVGVVDARDVLFQRVYGRGADENTPFLLGSLSKSFTALAIMQLAEEGRIDLDAPVTTYLRSARTKATIRDLLNHTSGLGTYDTTWDYATGKPTGKHEYANVNYALLGKVIEAVTGMKYAAYIKRYILDPLGMDETTADPAYAAKHGLVQGNINLFGMFVPSPPYIPGREAWIQPAAGYISSSLSDMERYLQMYLREGERLLAPKGIEAMLNDGVKVDDDIPYTYAMGWSRIDLNDSETVYRHAGLVETGMSCMYLLPEQGLGVVLLANANDYLVGTDLMDRIGWNFVLRLMGDEPEKIEAGEYGRAHAWWNLAYAAMLAAGILPYFFIGRYFLKAQNGPGRKRVLRTILCFFVLPTALLLAIPIGTGTPLWVVQAFVPDLLAVLVASSALLYAGGVIRLAAPAIAARMAQRDGAGR